MIASHARLHFQTIMKPRLIFLLSQSVAIITCLQQSPKIAKDITIEQAESVSTSPNFDIFIFFSEVFGVSVQWQIIYHRS